MGAGLSKKQLYGRQYRLLQRHMGTLINIIRRG